MTRRLLIAAGAIAGLTALYLGLSAFIVSEMLTPHSPCRVRVPADSGLVAEKIRFLSHSDRIPLVGWLLPNSRDRAVVLLHGLSSNSWTGTQEDIARAYFRAGFHVLVFDGRGRGLSGGDRLGLGWHERGDVRGAVDLLLERGIEPGRIGVHGTSYGAATAILSAAAIPEVGAVVADSAFADVRDIMDEEIKTMTGVPSVVTRLLRPGIALVARLGYALDLDAIPPERAVPKIAPRPILFIHGSEDERIPVEHARRLKAEATNSPHELWILQGFGHTDGVRIGKGPKCLGKPSPIREVYLSKVTAFFDHSLR